MTAPRIDIFGQADARQAQTRQAGGRAPGSDVSRIALEGHGFSAGILTLGAILQDFRQGARPLTLGAAELAAYDRGPMRYFGAVIGPVAGRIGGARGPLDGGVLTLEANDGANTLHSGSAGLHDKIWQIDAATRDAVDLSVALAPGEGGFPGVRSVRARYALQPGGLRLTLTARTDAPTWMNLTQHSYWHLGGAAGIDGHRLEIAAERYLPVDAQTLPAPAPEPVAGTRFDFRSKRRLTPDDGLDHCFCFDPPGGVAPVARLIAPDDLTLTLRADAPGLQVHTGDGVGDPNRPGLALEAQDWPDAPNRPGFPSIRLEPGVVWQRTMEFVVTPVD